MDTFHGRPTYHETKYLFPVYFTCQSVFVCMCVCVNGHLYATDDSINVVTK